MLNAATATQVALVQSRLQSQVSHHPDQLVMIDLPEDVLTARVLKLCNDHTKSVEQGTNTMRNKINQSKFTFYMVGQVIMRAPNTLYSSAELCIVRKHNDDTESENISSYSSQSGITDFCLHYVSCVRVPYHVNLWPCATAER